MTCNNPSERIEHPRAAVLCHAIPPAATGDANFGKTTAIGRREVASDGQAVADPGFPIVDNDGGKTGVDIAPLAGVQGLVHWREDAQGGDR